MLKPRGYDELVKVLANPEAVGVSEEKDDVPAPRVGDMLVAQKKLEREQVEEAAAVENKSGQGKDQSLYVR